MQNNEFAYSFDSRNKTIYKIKLEPDSENGGYLSKPNGTSYIDPSTIGIADNETLMLKNEKWEKIPYYVGTILYHKKRKISITIYDAGKSLDDYPDFTDKEIPDFALSCYFEYSEQTKNWEFDFEKYKSDALKRITDMCVNENYSILPREKRENILAGSPASDGYPQYLQGEKGKANIAKLNNIFQVISKEAKSDIQSANSKNEVDEIILGIIFPSEAEILASILK